MTATNSLDPRQAFAELARIRLGETELDGVLAQVADLAQRSIAGADEVSVTLVGERGAHTATFTGDRALALDEFQYGCDRGPCLDASTTAGTFVISDTREDRRWAQFADRAAEAGVRSSLAVGLPVQVEVTGALNLYSVRPGAFDEEAVTVAQTFAGYAAVALANVRSYDASTALAAQMREAMANRAVIEQAKGIVMAERRCSPDEAFDFLSRTSQRHNRKLRDIAGDLVSRASGRSG